MNEVKAISIWEDLPDDWQEPVPPADEVTSGSGVQPAPAEEAPHPTSGVTTSQPGEAAPERSARANRKKEKEKLQEFQRKDHENRRNASESTRNAYREENRGNRRDFIILGALLFVAACVIVGLVISSTRMSTERVYDLIEQGNYSVAYQCLSELAQDEQNVDRLVYAFCEACVEDSEYKRAVASLEYLSADAEKNAEFFKHLVESLLSHRKVNRAKDVLDYLYGHGENLRKLADQLVQEHPELS